MPSPEPGQLRRIFDLVFEAPPGDREAILTRECAGDPVLRRRVEAMLAGASDERFLAEPTIDKSAAAAALGSLPFTTPVAGEQPGDRIGPYKLLTRIGEGGFGSVFLAEQDVPVKRRVALKIIKLGMDTKQVVARFEQERQALAIMDHPHVARVYDAGATDSGRPYFVMEFCAGDAITDYCDRNHLNIRDRLTLFLQVCTAVQHAHQRGLIHRDIKPSNVLVTTQDGKPHAKVIDFGIAKATASKLTEKTLFTEHRQLIGTPEYMSPEQAEGSLDIDTRTDVYALGVLLYELLTGLTPFDARSLRSATYAEMQRIIREVDPPKPSTRIKQSVDTASDHASRRRVEPRRLDTMLRGELDWIVMKAIEKDRGRRYDSPNALATDLQLYLAGEAVTAAPPSRTYLMRKFVRRNKGPVSTVTAVGIALFAGVIAFAWQASVARRERDRAVHAEAETARQADAARRERDRAVQAEAETALRAEELQKVSDFQSEMLAKIQPSDAGFWLSADVRTRLDAALVKAGTSPEERGKQVAAFSDAWARINATDAALALIKSALFSPALDTIDRKFADQPKLNATLRAAIATRYLDLGLYEDALKVFDQALELRRRALGPDHPDTRAMLIAKSKVLTYLGRTDEAEAIVRPIASTQPSGDGSEDPLALRALEMVGESRIARNQWADAEAIFRRSLAGRRKALGDDHIDTLQSMGNLAMALRGQAKFAEAEKLARDVLERRLRIFGEGNPYTNGAYNNVAVILLDEGRAPEALEYFQKAADGHRQALGDTHRDTLLARNNLANTLGKLGRREEALVIQRDLFEQTRKAFGPDHPDSLRTLTNLASGLIEVGKLDEAEPLCHESLERQVRVYGAKSAQAATANNVMAYLLRRQNRDAEAEPFLQTSVDIARVAWGLDHPERMVVLNNLAALKRKLGQLETSETMYRETVERTRRALGPDHPQYRVAIQGLADTLIAAKRDADAEAVLAGAEEDFRRAAARDDQGELRTLLIILARSRAAQRKFELAEANYKEAYDRYIAARGPTSKGAQVSAAELTKLYETWDEANPNAGHAAQAAEWRARLQAASSQPAASQPATSQPAASQPAATRAAPAR